MKTPDCTLSPSVNSIWRRRLKTESSIAKHPSSSLLFPLLRLSLDSSCPLKTNVCLLKNKTTSELVLSVSLFCLTCTLWRCTSTLLALEKRRGAGAQATSKDISFQTGMPERGQSGARAPPVSCLSFGGAEMPFLKCSRLLFGH